MSNKTKIPFNPFQMISFYSKRIKYIVDYHSKVGGSNREIPDYDPVVKSQIKATNGVDAIENYFRFLMFDYDIFSNNTCNNINKQFDDIDNLIETLTIQAEGIDHYNKTLIKINQRFKQILSEKEAV